MFYHTFQYQAKSWKRSRRVVAKVEWHLGELFSRVGFIVTNLTWWSKRVVRFYNGRAQQSNGSRRARTPSNGRSFPAGRSKTTAVKPIRLDWCAGYEVSELVQRLPRLVDLKSPSTDIRCTAWQRGNQCTRLFMNLGENPINVTINGNPFNLAPGKVHQQTEKAPETRIYQMNYSVGAQFAPDI